MAKKTFSTAWKASSQLRKQRLFRYNAPLHIKQKLMHIHLSSELREKYGLRNILVRKGDTVKIMHGQWKKKEGKVERVDLKRGRIFVTGANMIKKDGTKVMYPLHPSNVMALQLELNDKKRKRKLESKQPEIKVKRKETKK